MIGEVKTSPSIHEPNNHSERREPSTQQYPSSNKSNKHPKTNTKDLKGKKERETERDRSRDRERKKKESVNICIYRSDIKIKKKKTYVLLHEKWEESISIRSLQRHSNSHALGDHDSFANFASRFESLSLTLTICVCVSVLLYLCMLW